MADYIYTMESRLTPDQLKAVLLVQDVTRAAGMNLYLTGGAVRDIISGLPIRDLDFTVQGNPLKLQKELERAGIRGYAHQGAHIFRHSLATELLGSGATLSEIGQLLRHGSHDTTRIYAKVDIEALRTLSPPWQGGVQ